MNKSLTRFATKSNIALFILAGLALLVYTSVVYYKTIYTDETNVFWSSMEANLKTSSVTKITEESNPTQIVRQDQDLNFKGELSVSNKVSITSPTVDDVVSVETRGFSNADFLQYTEITLSDQAQQEAVADGVGIWAVQTAPEDEEVLGQQRPELVQESLVSSFILFGNLNYAARADVVDGLRNSYTINDFKEIDRDGRTTIEYNVSVDLLPFADTLVAYLSSMGYEDYGQQIREQTAQSQTVPITVLIDKQTRTIVETRNEQGGVEKFTAIGALTELERPETIVTYQELQGLLSQ